MRVLVSKLSRQAGDSVARQSQIVEGDTITIGRATDQTIHSLDPAVALQHALISRSITGKLVIRSLAKTGLIINGSPAQRSELSPGDRVELANLTIEVEAATEGNDIGLAVQSTAVEYSSAALEKRYALNLGRAGLKNRRWAWAWGLAWGCLVVPVGTAASPSGPPPRRVGLPSATPCFCR